MTDQSLELHTVAIYAPNLLDISDLGIQLYVCTGVFALVGAFTVYIYVKENIVISQARWGQILTHTGVVSTKNNRKTQENIPVDWRKQG